MPQVANHYMTMQIGTASRQKQITMLHEKCVELIQAASTKIPFDGRVDLDKAQNILAQLQSALRLKDTTSQSLFVLYDYVYTLLEQEIQENCWKALKVMKVLRDTFRELLLAT